MRPNRFSIGVVFGLGIILPALCACRSEAKEKSWRLGAWLTYWNFDRGVVALASRPAVFDDAYFFIVHFRSDGALELSAPGETLARHLRTIQEQKARPWMTIVNDLKTPNGPVLKDAQIIHDLLSVREKRREHIRQIVQLALKYGFSGVDIDYENLRTADQDHFSQFIEELAAALEKSSLKLSVTVQPKKGDSKAAGPGAADYARLGKAADRLQIMLYNLHGQKGEPGPIATPPWISEVLRYAARHCPSDKLVPILKLSGHDWGPEQVEGLRCDQAISLAERHRSSIDRDPIGKIPHFTYQNETGKHTVYFEDVQSIQEKVETIRALGLKTLVFWSLGQEDPALLGYLAELKKTIYQPPAK